MKKISIDLTLDAFMADPKTEIQEDNEKKYRVFHQSAGTLETLR